MKKQKILKIINITASIAVSLILILSAVFIPLYLSVTALTRPETVTDIIRNCNYKSALESNPEISSVLEAVGIDSEQIDKAIKNEKNADIIEKYVGSAVKILNKIPIDEKFEVNEFFDRLDKNIADIIDIAKENIDADIPAEEIKDAVHSGIDKNKEIAAEIIPIIKPAVTAVRSIGESKLLHNTLSPQFTVIFMTVFFILLILLYVLQRKKRKSFIWLSAVFFISASAMLIIIYFSGSSFLVSIADNISDFNADILRSTVSVCRKPLYTGFTVSALLGTVFISIYLIPYIYLKRKKIKLSGTEKSPSAL